MTDDEFQAHATREAAKAIGEWLEATLQLDRQLRTLRLFELEAIAAAAISRYVVVASGEAAKGNTTPVDSLLYGG
ncbi:hypothetical protein [Azospirillum oryzae]|uniref:hypothetical protein n=1 Tax=Azospirillum oryzae TaxID=286727 RepID=UPI000A147A4E|nr:hypothetical protein [Azospirillum oryzae]